MRKTVLILLICLLTHATAFSELTKDDLEAIQKVVQAEIAASEQRTGDKLAAINTEIANIKTEIKVVKTDIQGVKDRLGDIRGLVIGVIGLMAIIIILAAVVNHTAGKLGTTAVQLDKIYASADETKELLQKNTEARNEYTAEVREANRLLGENAKMQEEQNTLSENIQAKIDELLRRIEEESDEPTNDTIAHAPAD